MKGPPVIIFGMHRSGTALVTRCLDHFGLFVGSLLDSNHESVFFLDLNEWMLSRCGARWDHPGPFREADVTVLARELKPRLNSWKRVLYRGLATPGVWGWKDPRNTFTLPVWRLLFPEARLIHVVRHGIDVAQSLKVREERRTNRKPWSRLGRLILRNRQLNDRSDLCRDLSGGFSLWEEYMNEAARRITEAGDRGLEIRFEELARYPERVLKTLAAFCGLNYESLPGWIHADRAESYRKNPELMRFASGVRDRLASFGY